MLEAADAAEEVEEAARRMTKRVAELESEVRRADAAAKKGGGTGRAAREEAERDDRQEEEDDEEEESGEEGEGECGGRSIGGELRE